MAAKIKVAATGAMVAAPSQREKRALVLRLSSRIALDVPLETTPTCNRGDQGRQYQ
jgi:hypothetical protein